MAQGKYRVVTVFSNSWTVDGDPVIYQNISSHHTFDAAIRGLERYEGTDRAMIFKVVDGRARLVNYEDSGNGLHELTEEEIASREKARAAFEVYEAKRYAEND